MSLPRTSWLDKVGCRIFLFSGQIARQKGQWAVLLVSICFFRFLSEDPVVFVEFAR